MHRVLLSAVVLSSATLFLSPAPAQQHHAEHAEARPADKNPVADLQTEHQLIAQVVHAAAREAGEIEKSGQVDSARVGEMVAFFQNFADACHHIKEERYLFPRLRQVGVDAAAIDLMLGQHQHGRQLLKEAAALLIQPDGMSREETLAIGQRLAEYAKLMHEHIGVEDGKLWPAAEKHLPADVAAKVRHAFDILETVELGEDFHAKYHALAESILRGSAGADHAHH